MTAPLGPRGEPPPSTADAVTYLAFGLGWIASVALLVAVLVLGLVGSRNAALWAFTFLVLSVLVFFFGFARMLWDQRPTPPPGAGGAA